jgi:hypothetical protein
MEVHFNSCCSCARWCSTPAEHQLTSCLCGAVTDACKLTWMWAQVLGPPGGTGQQHPLYSLHCCTFLGLASAGAYQGDGVADALGWCVAAGGPGGDTSACCRHSFCLTRVKLQDLGSGYEGV